jgi:hypothetical protein
MKYKLQLSGVLLFVAVMSAHGVELDVNWPAFLSRHDLLFNWTWGDGSLYTLKPRAMNLSRCGDLHGSCCLQANDTAVVLGVCDPDFASQQWKLLESGQYASAGRCLRAATNGQSMLAPCAANDSKQVWRSIDGYLYNPSSSRCLQIATAQPFCEGTICPRQYAKIFRAQSAITTASCANGDRSQLFTAFTLPTPSSPLPRKNLIPLTWATSAYAGNGLIGVRVASEAGGIGVIRVLMDRVDIGAYSHRQPTGYYRMITNIAHPPPLQVSMRQSLYDGSIRGNITGAGSSLLFSFKLFVNAATLGNNKTTVVIDMRTYQTAALPSSAAAPVLPLPPVLEWVPCASVGNNIVCGSNASTSVENMMVDGVNVTVQKQSGFAWAHGWRYLAVDQQQQEEEEQDAAENGEVTLGVAGSVREASTTTVTEASTTTVTRSIAIASIGACGTPACMDPSMPLDGALCPCISSTSTSTSSTSTSTSSNAPPTNSSVAVTAVVSAVQSVHSVQDLERVWQDHSAWWASYWPQSFVTIPVTRLEGYYYTQMYRFVSSDRVGLHGLMGAFGPSSMFNLWSDDVWDMNEQVMYWIGPASNRPQIWRPMMRYMEQGRTHGGGYIPVGKGLWMVHNYMKALDAVGDVAAIAEKGFPMVVAALPKNGSMVKDPTDGFYHILHCGSPEYTCFPPFDQPGWGRDPHCKIDQDCTYALSQLRWGLRTAIFLAKSPSYPRANATRADVSWWEELMSRLVPYPTDPATGYKLDRNCSFRCPHRHFSHLLQIYDLETSVFSSPSDGHHHQPVPPAGGAGASRASNDGGDADDGNRLMLRSLDNFYAVTCNESNWFNEECRGFTQCALSAMSTVTARPEAAAGNLSALVDSVITPNGMYGEMVYFHHPDEFCPVSESGYCGAGSLHTMLLHTTTATATTTSSNKNDSTKILQLFPGLPPSWPNASFHQLRADGGLIVSAVREAGSTQWVRLAALVGGTFDFEVPFDKHWRHSAGVPRSVPATAVVTASPSRNGTWRVTLEAEEGGGSRSMSDVGMEVNTFAVVLYPAGNSPLNEPTIAPLVGEPAEYNWFGYSREMQPLH